MHAFDRQTDRQTDRRTEISSLRPRCIPCSAVKTSRVTRRAFSHIWEAKGGNGIFMKFCMILHGGKGPRRNHPCKFRWRSVHGFFEGAGVEFPTFPLTCVVVLKTLPCQRVMTVHSVQCSQKTENAICNNNIRYTFTYGVCMSNGSCVTVLLTEKITMLWQRHVLVEKNIGGL